MKNIAHMLDVIDQVRDHMALGLMSDPGLSKTSQVKQWAEDHGRQYCELIISQRMPSEISGMPMPVNDSRTMEVFDFDTLLKLQDGDVLAFDEFTNGNIQTLNACLTLIQERTMLSGKKLPSLVIVAMGNPMGKCELLPQTKQRFWWVDVTWDEATWKEYMRRTWNVSVTQAVLAFIGRQYTSGFGPQKHNFVTPRTVENMFRVAMTVPQDDIFWQVSMDIDRSLVEAIYACLEGRDEFEKSVEPMRAWAREHVTDVAHSDFNLVYALAQVRSATDVKALIASLEESGEWPEFIEFLKTMDERPEYQQEWKEANPSFTDRIANQPILDPSKVKPFGSVMNAPAKDRRFRHDV